MAKTTLDRISMGNFESSEDGKILENKGKVSFKLYYNEHVTFNPYYIYASGERTNGEMLSSKIISQTKKVGQQRFLSEVNDNLDKMNCYIAEAKYSKGFPIFGSPSVKGILYKETEKKKSGNFQEDIE